MGEALFAIVAQLVELRLPKPKVAGSSPVYRSIINLNLNANPNLTLVSQLMARVNVNVVVVFVFLVLAVFDFIPMSFPARMIFPLLWLTLCALCQKQWALAGALFFSFLGDVMGWRNELIPQIGFFAIAQVLYIIIYSVLIPPKQTWSKPVKFILLALIASVYAVAMFWIFPRVGEIFIRYGIAVYALLLLGMCFAACRHKCAFLMLGAVLFVVSDFILGVHLFVERIPHAHLSIMIPYYLGQLLLYVGTLNSARGLR